MLNKKRENPSKDKEKEKDKNIKYILDKNKTYTLDGYGKLKLIEGNLSLMGYSLNMNETINFNFNEDYPLFKYINSSTNFSKFEIFEESKYHLYTDINSLVHVSFIPKALTNLDIENYSKLFILGNKCVGKNMLIPYIINRILSKEEYNLFFLECDIIHPLIPFNYCLSLIKIKKPIISNIPILLEEENYQLIKSIYIRDSSDIKNLTNIFDILIANYYEKIADNKSILLINQFSNWDNNYDILNNYVFKKYFKSNNNSCLIYIKNKYKIIEENENKEKNNNSLLEDIIFKNKNDFHLFGNLFGEEKNDIINHKCKKIEVDSNFRYGDDDSNSISDLNNKKKIEEQKNILYYFNINKCKKYSISKNDIIILYDNPFINEFINDSNKNNITSDEILIGSLINKYCVILKNDHNLKIDNILHQNYFNIDDISFNEWEIISYSKIISYNKSKNILNILSYINLEEEIKKNKKIIIINEPRIDKLLKKNKKENLNLILSKAEFSYDITKEDETKMLTNGLNYLGKYEDEFN